MREEARDAEYWQAEIDKARANPKTPPHIEGSIMTRNDEDGDLQGTVPDDATPAPVKVEDVSMLLREHQPTRWRSFTTEEVVLRCCGQDFGSLSKKRKRDAPTSYELWADHVAIAIAAKEASHGTE